jgi:hypothetical protein
MRSKYFIDADNDESRVPLPKTSEDRSRAKASRAVLKRALTNRPCTQEVAHAVPSQL